MEKAIKRHILTANDLRIREKEDGSESRTITGCAIVFDTPSEVLVQGRDWEVREIIAREAVPKALLDASDIKMTMFHDRQLILARSNKGKGTLKYDVREDGVYFEFDAPATADGDKALELVRRRDIAGCSFAFYAEYDNREKVELNVETVDGRELETYTVREIEAIVDFTLAADPAYPATDVNLLRELSEQRRSPAKKETAGSKHLDQIREMRETASYH